MDILEHLVRTTTSRAAIPSLAAWLDHLDTSPFDPSLDRALWGGFEADRLGYAFVAGYHGALARLVGGSRTRRMSLAVTESGGGHPRAIQTTLDSSSGALGLRGEKTFATLASVSDELLIVASAGPGVDGRNQLRLVRVAKDTEGVTIEDRPPAPFAPEVPHAKVVLADVMVRSEDVLPGDGYAEYVKPFRTIEDTHVLAAVLAYLVRSARAFGFAPEIAERAIALIAALQQIATYPPADPVGHIALAGAFEDARRVIADSEDGWKRVDAETSARWRRDLGLLVVATNVRQKRAEAAWKATSARASEAGAQLLAGAEDATEKS